MEVLQMLSSFEERTFNLVFDERYKFGVINYKDEHEQTKTILKVEDELFIINQTTDEKDFIDIATVNRVINRIVNQSYQYLGSGFLNFVPKATLEKVGVKHE